MYGWCEPNGGVKKLIVAVIAIAGVALLAKLFGSKFENVDWEKRFASMPDNAPPKWMFRNISEIHDNTERILELLDTRDAERSAGTNPEGVAAPNAT